MQSVSKQHDKMNVGGVVHMRLTMPAETAHLAVVEGLTGNPDGRWMETKRTSKAIATTCL